MIQNYQQLKGNIMNHKVITNSLIVLTALTVSACIPTSNGPVAPHTHIGTVPATVVTPATSEPTPVETAVPVATAPAEQYVVQLTASNSQQKAQNIRNKFTADGYNAFVSPLTLNGKLLHRVQIGMFNDKEDAQMVLAQMKVKYPGDPYVAAAITKTP